MICIIGTQIAVSQGYRLYIAIRVAIETLKKECCNRKNEKVTQQEEDAVVAIEALEEQTSAVVKVVNQP